MAVTVTSIKTENGLTEDKWGKAKVMLRTLTISGTYATAGFALSPSAFGLKKIHSIVVNEQGAPTTSYTYHYNRATSKVQLFGSNGAAPAALAEIADTTAIGTRTVDILAIGWV